jgi:hypothetical protein
MKKLFTTMLTGAVAAAALSGSAHGAIIELLGQDITVDTRWTRDNVYVLLGAVYILPPAKLTIEPGTLIRAASDPATPGATNPGSLIATRGAKLVGSATVDDPIIFTSADDTLVPGGSKTRPTTLNGSAFTALNYSPDGPQGENLNAFSISRQCGGVVLLGRAPIAYDGNGAAFRPQYDDASNIFSGENLALPTGVASPELVAATTNESGNGAGFAVIEGFTFSPATLTAAVDQDQTAPFSPGSSLYSAVAEVNVTGTFGGIAASTAFNRSVFGGVNENDDSGVQRFWSIRYGGFEIAPGLEINGFTTGAAGRNTVSEFIDVANNADDCFEFFGGYNNMRYISGWFGGDDYIDWDMGYSGNIQNAFMHTGGGEGFGRSGFAVADAPATAGKNPAFNNSERAFELDGPEPNGVDLVPESHGHVFNVTVIGNRGGSSSTTSDEFVRARRGTWGLISHIVAEDINDNVLAVDSGTAPIPAALLLPPLAVETDLQEGFHFNTGTVNSGLIAGITFNTTVASTSSQLTAKGANGGLTKNGVDPTLKDEAPAGTTVPARKLTASVPQRSGVANFFSPVTYRGGLRDNNWMFGWTWAHAASLLPTTNVDRPVVTLTVVSGNVNVSFNADTSPTTVTAPDAVLYVVERSLDAGATFVPFVAVQDGGTGDLNAAAGTIRVADSIAYAGANTQYRVIPQ